MTASLAASISVVALDLGAESGRALVHEFDGRHLTSREVYRFANTPHTLDGHLRWNWPQLQTDIAKGLALAADAHPVSAGVDTWGVDFGLLDAEGKLLAQPIHYRDAARSAAQNVERLFARASWPQIFDATGIQNMSINTIFQLFWDAEHASPLLERAKTFLMIPDLINHWLSGSKVCEFTDATTSQCFDPRRSTWAFDLLAKVGVPTHLFPEVVLPGTRLGKLRLADHPLQGIELIAPATHDTASAVAAVPAATKNYAYLSSGTWSLLGLESPTPIINDAARTANITNEGGVEGTYRLLKNIVGLWLVQESRRAWAAQGQQYDYDTLVSLANNAPPFVALIDPDAPEFLPPGDMPARIRDYCVRTRQPIPQDAGAITRCIFESLALKYRFVLDRLIGLTGQTVDVLHIIGGGSNNKPLCQMAANAINREVLAGPAEATGLGNALMQLVALGKLDSVAQGREVVRASVTPAHYAPHPAGWDEAYGRFLALMS